MARVFLEINEESGYKYFPKDMQPETDGRLYFVIKKAMYGLFESGRIWYNHVKAFLKTKCQLVQTETDPCVFIRKNKT